MGKHGWIEDDNDQSEDNHPGCMWGIFRALDYHHWHYNVKKMIPHTNNHGRRHVKGNKSPKTRWNVQDSGEVQKLLDTEASQFHSNQKSTESSSTNKRFLKARIKALVAEGISKEEDHKRPGAGFPACSRLRRTFSIHHLEPSEHGLDKISTDRKHQIIFLHKNADNSATRTQDPAWMKGSDKPVTCNQKFDVCFNENVVDDLEHNLLAENQKVSQEKCDKARETSEDQNLMEANQPRQITSLYQLKEHVDVLELFKVNKDLFQKFLQNTDHGLANFCSLQASNTKARLTKSGSFPMADLSRKINFRPSKLKHKQNESWSFPKGESAATREPNLVASKFLKDLLFAKSGHLMADDMGGSVLYQETSFPSLGLTQELDKEGSNKEAIPLNDNNKQRIEVSVKEGKIESNCTSVDALFVEVPPQKEMTEWNESTLGGDGNDSSLSGHETDGSINDLSKGTLTHIRRTSSLNESLDRYSRLFEHSFSREAKWPLSKSLKLTNEYEILSGGHALLSFIRIRSLPHLDFYSSLQNDESHDSHFSGLSTRNVIDGHKNIENNSQDKPNPVGLSVSTDEYVRLDANEETTCLDSIVESSDVSPRMEYSASLTVGINDEGSTKVDGLSEKMEELTVGKSKSHKKRDTISIETASNKLPQPISVSVLESCFQGQVTSLAELPISEGLECRLTRLDEKEYSVNSLNISDTDFLPQSSSTVYPENFENANKSVENHRHFELYLNDEADFNYVSNILERSGFTENGFCETWHSSDQPLNPALFKELEDCWPHDPECSEEDTSAYCHHERLFDLVNEVLLQIYDRSFTYYPRALSSTCHIRPVPVGYHLLEEVWASISRSLSVTPELEQSLDSVVAQDLAKDYDWMNLQWESECVALELEDMIFDELLEEVLCS